MKNSLLTPTEKEVHQDRENYQGGFINTKGFFALHPQLISSAWITEIPFDFPFILSLIQSKWREPFFAITN